MAANLMSLLLVLLLLLGAGTSLGSKKCEYQSNCGVVIDIKSPFRFKGDSQDCGLPDYELTCAHNHTVLQLGSSRYFVEAIDYEYHRIRISDPRVHKGNCSTLPECSSPANDYQPLCVSSYNDLIVLMICKSPAKSPYYVDSSPCMTAMDFSLSFEHSTEELSYSYALIGNDLWASDIEDSCSIYKIILMSSTNFFSDSRNITFSDIHDVLASGFYLEWPRYEFSFAARILSFLRTLLLWALFIVALAIAARALVGITALFVFLIYKCRRSHLSAYDTIEEFLQNRSDLMPIRYSYKEIKKMTNNFKDKLGKGGYGDVYEGKCRSGHLVAVKVLNAAKGSGQDFINEVATIGRIYHINVVGLVGFCATSSKRALVYDYMPNGSLDKFIFSDDPNVIPLSWERAYEIAVGVARGIAYLHQGCNMQILHFDIKPHNVLLDENFVPKISDFGLAKLYPTQKSTVTLTAVKGTIGYMAPELIYKKRGVSHKADVYSFGQLLLAIVGRRRVNSLTDHSSHVYSSSWIYKIVDRGEDEDLDLGNITGDDKEIVRKIILVALWCVQWAPADRPSIREVLEMLEGDLENLRLPPKPLYYLPDSPARAQSSHQDTEDSSFPPCESVALEIEQSD